MGDEDVVILAGMRTETEQSAKHKTYEMFHKRRTRYRGQGNNQEGLRTCVNSGMSKDSSRSEKLCKPLGIHQFSRTRQTNF